MGKYMFSRGSGKRGLRFLLFPLGGLVFVGILAFGLGALVMVLWNWVMPDLLGVNEITYWQSWGLLLLSHILFKFAPRRSGRPPWARHGGKEEWREQMRHWKERGKDSGEEPGGEHASETPPAAGPEPEAPHRA
jgi:hypothetical protein